MQNKLWVLPLLVLMAAALACSLPAGLAGSQPEGAKQDQPAEASPAENYPAAPEEVVQEFLSAYAIDPAWMTNYLSRQRLANLPPGGALELVQLHGELEGFSVLAAAVNPDPPAALVTVALRVGGAETQRSFSLVMENGRWVIDAIEIPPED
ncbi:MAG: hypothetical protein U1B80_07610 [Anaerolineaceae bacterium]|nr:hypothetical protein [Anaerolineaceae bacterium]